MGSRAIDAELGEIPADEAFATLGHETRLDVLRALWEAGEPRSFAELRERVAPDDTGNFSYHLGKLAGHFIRKTEDGYALRFAGEQVVRAVLTGTITADPTVPPAATDERCCFCDAPVEMAYRGEVIAVRCTECGGVTGREHPPGTYMHYEFPPAGLIDRTRESAIDAAHVHYDAKLAPMTKGVCPECAGPIAVTHDVCDDHATGVSGLCQSCDTRYEVWSVFECEHCRYRRRSVMWFAALAHPAVVSFLHEHGLDEPVPIRKLTRANARYVRDITGSVVETDPYRFRVTVPIEGERLEVDLDAELDVLGVRRADGDEGPGSGARNDG